jgi:flavin reductase (DIM6/NTAB) family NADH-FMN oxidoreductase RutF
MVGTESPPVPSPPGVDIAWAVAQRFPTGVSVLTAGSGSAVRGCTVSAFCLVSRDPALVSVCLRRDSSVLDLIHRSGRFTVNVLSSEQSGLARHFASRYRGSGRGQFDGIGWAPGDAGVPTLTATVCWLHCRPCARVAAGDHELVLANVLSLAEGTGTTPLLYYAGALYPGAIDDPDGRR